MDTAIKLYKWCKHPHWTWQLAAWAFGAAVVVCWFLTGTLFRGLGAVVTLVTGYCLFQLGRWVWLRVRLTTEAGIPLSPVRMVRDIISERAKFVDAKDRWALAMRAQKVVYDGQSPNLHRMQQTATGDVKARINLAALGGNLEQITRLAADGTLAGIMHCQEVSVQPTSRLGQAWITFYKAPPLQRALTLADLPQSRKDRISFGIEESGEVAAVRYGLSMLIAGTTGAGKSVLFKDMFADILRDGQPTEMYFVDPKRAELRRFKDRVGQRIGNILVAGYCNSGPEAVAMFQEFAAEMHERQERMAQAGLTEIKTPTAEFPVRIIVVDELLDVIPAFPKTGSPMQIAISQGRATLDSVIGIAQMAKIATLGDTRDLFPLRACLRTMTAENTKAVLGIGENEGAPCSRIPLGSPGVGYYVTDEGTIRKFRAAKVTDAQWAGLIEGRLPEGMPVNVEHTGPPCFVYIAQDKAGGCGYVGIAGGYEGQRHPVARRRAEHRRYDRVWCAEHERVENWWVRHIADTTMEVRKYPSRAAALIAEERLIKELRPRWNITHNGANPLSNLNVSKRASWKRRALDAGREYVEAGREVQAVRQVVAGYRKAERVEAQRVKADRFVERAERDSYVARSAA